MKIIIKSIVSLMLLSTFVYGQSEMAFPKEWKSYKSVKTPLSTLGALPGCDTDVSHLPSIYQETVSTYCAIKQNGPGAVEILVSNTKAFQSRSGNYQDGTTYILHLKDLKVLFVTQWKDNKPLYGAYTEDGIDVSNKIGSGLNPQDCRSCHTGYQAFCLNGQCATQIK
jgi:hypothetical protein